MDDENMQTIPRLRSMFLGNRAQVPGKEKNVLVRELFSHPVL